MNKIRITWNIISIFTAVALVFPLPLGMVSATTEDILLEQTPGQCPFEEMDGRIIVSIQTSHIIVSNQPEHKEKHFKIVDASIPAGTYDISLASYDNHTDYTDNQTNESYYLILKKGTTTLGTTSALPDIPADQDEMQAIVETGFVIPEDVNKVTAYHNAGFGLEGDPMIVANSHRAVCAAFDEVVEEVPDPVCGNSIIEDGETCDDGNTTDGDGCSNICELESFECSDIDQKQGWYGKYFNYLAEHPDMNLNQPLWATDSHGDPLSDVESWDTNWYSDEYLKFSRVDSSLDFGENFFPLDMAAEELHSGGHPATSDHEFHFGVHWRALVQGDPGVYDYTLTSDDDAWVYVNGVLVEDNSRIHAPITKTGSTTLTGKDIVDVFFAERHVVRSHMSFEFSEGLTITPLPEECQPSVRVCKFDDLDGDGAENENTPIADWGIGLINTAQPVIESSTDVYELNVTPALTGGEGCFLYEGLLPGTYRVVEEARENWVPTEGQRSPVLDGLVISDEASTTPTDSFFDVFVEIDVDYEDEEEVNLYNYNIKYCGDGVINQSWEQCDGGEGCTQACQLEGEQMCNDLVLARIDTANVINECEGSATDDIYLGSAINKIPNGTWFALFDDGAYFTDPDISGYEDVEGLAVERGEGDLRLVLHGSKGQCDIEHVDGTVELHNAEILDLRSDNSSGYGKNNRLEKGFDGVGVGDLSPGDDEVSSSTPSTAEYYLTTNVADDGFYVDWEIVEDCIGICGVKFNDLDLDGIQEDGEENLAGWEITLYEEVETPVVCGDDVVECVPEVTTTLEPIATEITTDGGYCFDDVEAGTYVVGETQQDNWVNTTPMMVESVVFNGEETVYVDFGNAGPGMIHGMKFFDQNQNHEWDDGEPGLEGWQIELYQHPNAPWKDSPYNVPYASTTTDENGYYWFYEVPAGVYQIFEVNQEGWTQTAPWFAYEWPGSDYEEGSVVLPAELVPDAPFNWNTVDPFSDDGKWLSAKFTKNPTMLNIIGNAMDCVFNHYNDWGKCEDNTSLKNLHYYSVVIDSGTEIENAYFGNWAEEVVLGDCSDGEDNDDDGLIDENDPACHTDGDPENPDSYNPGGDEIELVITDEEQGEPNIDTLTIDVSWVTNKPATSRVVYGTTSVSDIDAVAAGDPLYGYSTTTETFDEDPKVETHTVTLSGLEEGVTYYWRPLSAASPEVLGIENSFIMESPPPSQCSDGVDNDGDGKVDMDDPGCSSPEDGNEGDEDSGGQGGGEGSGGGGGAGGCVDCEAPGGLISPVSSGGGGGFTPPPGGGSGPGPSVPPVTEGPIVEGPSAPSTPGTPSAPTAPTTPETPDETPEDTEDKEGDETDQLAAAGVLGFDYQCNWWTSILALIVLIAGSVYIFKRHNRQTEAIVGFVIGFIIFWIIGSWSCTWLLALLALIVILLIGWDMNHRRLNKTS